ncbi:MAG TPA: TetR/AcrR family transcriptional regulator [Streptomyces sp.]|uniref:TetR/AcrR family transcriptional regulator n=1 Tax=Streptomyces sp. TaxID=1931 RepID=UPI002BDDB44E|nr:TetR/AcrR family transcriptional regulator [Streptomyces sp.]HWU06501.1 TetR/AcrR family transcriptional regulator [Streptomyces sp.]
MEAAARPRKRGPYQRSHERRGRIALAVLQLVDELGHEGVTTSLVAGRSDSSEPTVLYHFPTKEHLLVAALSRSDDLELDLATAGGGQPTLDLSALHAVANAAVSAHERRLRLFVMLRGQAATPNHPAAEYFARRAERAMGVWTEMITRRQREGLAHPGLEPRETARQVLALWDGLVVAHLSDPGFDCGRALVDGVRRLTGQNWIEGLAALNRPGNGL